MSNQSDEGRNQLHDITITAMQLLRNAISHHPRMTAFVAVLAVAATAAAVSAFFGTSHEMAIIWIGLAVAIAHILRPWLIPNEQNNTARRLLDFMMWSMSILLLLVATAVAVSMAACRFGQFCPSPTQHVSIGTFSLLDEHKVDTSKPDAHILKKAEKVTRNTVWHAPGTSPLVALLTTVDDYSVRHNGEINLTIDLLVGTTPSNFSVFDHFTMKSKDGWRRQGLIDRYPGKVNALISELKNQGLQIGSNTIIALSTVTCLPKEVLESKTVSLKTIVYDNVSRTFSETEPISLKIEEHLAAVKGCGNVG